MSKNAVAAYAEGKLPASKAAKEFGFRSTNDLRSCVRASEWHHTSKEYNATDFFDVEQAIRDADWQELCTWKPHLTRTGWARLKVEIRQALRDQMAFDWPTPARNKGYFIRLYELHRKFPTPYQRHNGVEAVRAILRERRLELTEANYVAAKAEVDARRTLKGKRL